MNDKIAQQWGDKSAFDFTSNAHVLAVSFGVSFRGENPNDFIIRKPSAALPFDIKRAKAGDVVEWRAQNGEWVEIIDFKVSDRADYAHSGSYLGVNISFYCTDNLRMKFPPKTAKPQ